MPDLPRILVVLGPTAVGKSALAVDLALKFEGEIVSADSRQVYRGLDIGSGKITRSEMRGVPHHLLDVISPADRMTVADWKLLADQAIEGILARGRLPIVVGGSGFYIQAVVDNVSPPAVFPNEPLRQELEQISTPELASRLQELDRDRWLAVDKSNRRRLIRAIEIASVIGSVPKLPETEARYRSLQLGLKLTDTELKDRIKTRLKARVDQGLIAEVELLRTEGVSLERLDELGLEYRFAASHLQGLMSEGEMLDKLEIAIWQYARRQKTWFYRDQRIKWFSPEETELIEREVESFLVN